MAPPLLFDISDIDLTQRLFDVDAIEAINPHRGGFRMLDGIVWANDDLTKAVAVKDVREDEFWVPWHIPGRPVFPGVLMLEAAAQLASFVTLKRLKDSKFVGFAGLDDVKFRSQVGPGDQLLILSDQIDFRPRRCICKTQGIANGTLVFQATVTGMPM